MSHGYLETNLTESSPLKYFFFVFAPPPPWPLDLSICMIFLSKAGNSPVWLPGQFEKPAGSWLTVGSLPRACWQPLAQGSLDEGEQNPGPGCQTGRCSPRRWLGVLTCKWQSQSPVSGPCRQTSCCWSTQSGLEDCR